MKEDWKKCKLGEVCNISSSKRIFAEEYTTDGIPFYRGKEIIEKRNKITISSELFISYERFEEIKTKFSIPKIGDILLTSVGTIGVPWLVNEENFYFKDGNLTWLRCNNKFIHSPFLYYWLESDYSKNQINAKCIGSTQKALTIDTLCKFEINLPPLATQQKIATILSSLDDKIELNNKINDNLEHQSQAIFKSWFVDNSEKNHTIGEYIIPKRGKNLLSKDAIWGDVPVVAGGLEPATYHNSANTKPPVLTISASGANAGFVNLWNIPVWSSDSSFIDLTMTKEVYFWYVLLKLRQKEIFDSQTGSAQPHIYPQHISVLPIAELDMTKVSEFTKTVTPLFGKISENQQENRTLTTIRDTLLPKLMNGEIDVESVKI